MKFLLTYKMMNISDINRELQEIYREMTSWEGARGPFTPSWVRFREMILIKQQVLYQLEDAIKEEYNKQILFLEEELKVINDYLKYLQEVIKYEK